jgi:hypothetical protein
LGFLDKKIFKHIVEKYTKDYGCIIIDNSNKYDNAIDRLTYFKASDVSKENPKLFIGSIKD